jgi:glutamyl-tRNA reductase
VFVVGLSHRTAPVEVRERFAASTDSLPEVLARLSARPELSEVMFVSTCNRVEVYAASSASSEDSRAKAVRAVREVLAGHARTTERELESVLYLRDGDEAVRHIFRVAASLDSMVLGEPQILGQLKSAYEAAIAAGALKSRLMRCVQRAFAVAKRVRSETALGTGTVSISSVAVDLARRVFGDLAHSSVLLLGAGEMAEAAARSLGKGARAVRICNRSHDRAQALAQSIGGEAAAWDALEVELAIADVVVVSTASRSFVVTPELVRRVMKVRRGRTLLFVDIAVPRNVDPEVHGRDNVYVFDIDDLQQHVAVGLESRKAEAQAAERIVHAELEQFAAQSRGQSVQPLVVALRARTRGVLMAELERSLSTRLKHLPEGDRAALVQMLDSAANKLLHAPTSRLREAASQGDGALVETLRSLFELPEAAGGDATCSPADAPEGEPVRH